MKTIYSLFFPEDFVDAMRRMNPQEVANILKGTVNRDTAKQIQVVVFLSMKSHD